ncbi:MAG: hypothetical protein AAF449_22610 [Myxococcota bacterium]
MWRTTRWLQPWIGVILLGLGGFIGLLALSRGDLKAAAPALVGVGGASLIARATHGGRRWGFLLSGFAIAVVLFAMAVGDFSR